MDRIMHRNPDGYSPPEPSNTYKDEPQYGQGRDGKQDGGEEPQGKDNGNGGAGPAPSQSSISTSISPSTTSIRPGLIKPSPESIPKASPEITIYDEAIDTAGGVFSIDTQQEIEFSWRVSSSVTVSEVALLHRKSLHSNWDDISVPVKDDRETRSESVFQSVSTSRAVLNTSYFLSSSGSKLTGEYMAIRISWKTSQFKGVTQTRDFSIAKNQSDQGQVRSKLFGPENTQLSGGALTGFETVTATNSLALQTATSVQTDSTSHPTSVDSPGGAVDSADHHRGGGGGGLAPGAIAGIVVGGVAALFIAAVVAWFLLRRRRRQPNPAQVYPGKSSSDPYISDKHAAHAQTSESHHLPYADDAPATANSAHMSNASYQHNQFHDASESQPQPPHSEHAAGSDRDLASGTTSPQGVSRHLIEDGMTGDEINRLEAEERALDEAIQHSSRR